VISPTTGGCLIQAKTLPSARAAAITHTSAMSTWSRLLTWSPSAPWPNSAAPAAGAGALLLAPSERNSQNAPTLVASMSA
jgi:hypothetical protein